MNFTDISEEYILNIITDSELRMLSAGATLENILLNKDIKYTNKASLHNLYGIYSIDLRHTYRGTYENRIYDGDNPYFTDNLSGTYLDSFTLERG